MRICILIALFLSLGVIILTLSLCKAAGREDEFYRKNQNIISKNQK